MVDGFRLPPERRAVFVDRDGTLNFEVGFMRRMDQLVVLPGVVEGLRLLADAGYVFIVVSNQSGVARGLFDERRVRRINNRLRRMLRRAGIRIAAFYYCPYYIRAKVRRYRRDSPDRKPAPGMLLKGAARFGIDMSRSWLIGDRRGDIEAGYAAGCRTVLVRSGYGARAVGDPGWTSHRPHFLADDFLAAARAILAADDASAGVR